MKTKLSLCMLALTSTMAFGQSSKTIERQATKYPSTSNTVNIKKSNATPNKLASLSKGANSTQGRATIFQENFDGSGPGFAAWTTIDVDGRPRATAVNFITTGWNRIDRLGANGNYGGPAGDYAAMSTSWYTPAGTSNDWLITPSISIPAGTSTFQWDAKAQDADYPDGYKLMLAPNGGNTVADFTVELYSTTGENSEWITRTVNTSAYAGTNVRLAFVNNSTDMFMLLVDNILVDAVAAPVTGCLSDTEGQYPSTTFTPACNGSVASITGAAYLNEYSKVNVIGGTTYTFSTSNAAFFITIGDDAGATVLASGTGSVEYTPTANGVVRFYSHLSNNCDGVDTIHTRSVKCGLPPTEPTYGCDQTYNGVPDTAHNMTKNLATATFMVANDFFVPKTSGTYKLQSVNFDIVSQAAAGASDITSYDLKILADSGSNTPGSTVMTTLTGVTPTSVVTLPDTFAGFPTSRVTIDLGNFELPVNTTADTKYWVALTGTSASATSFYWIGAKYTEGWLTSSDYQSSDSGTTWVQGASTTDPSQHYEGQMMIDADCTTAAVSEAGNKNVSYFPNPVKDFLTINSKKKIETVHIYNVAGQKMSVSAKLVDGKVDMSKLAPGVYIVSTILDGGVNESFKVVKK